LTVFPAPPAPTHWSQRGTREIDAAIPRKIDPAAADANAVSLEGQELYTWDLAAIGPEALAGRGRSLDPDDLAAAGLAPPAIGAGGGLATEASA
jgi:hypothetical protein